jgi:hypothetical protein
MDDADGYFGERVAAGYDESTADMFEPASRCRPTVRHAGGIVTARRTAW